ncbi:MAG: hypothetical protein IBX62_10220 [Coriobacteriia bacterium]|nr:hypothetical protein [Coriobacteriia bacterium]
MRSERSLPERRTPLPEGATQPARWGWDFTLMVVTVGLLASLGLQSFLGTLYSWWAYRAVPGWEQFGYTGFVTAMNAVAAPQVVALVVVMGLCVPRRLFSRRVLAGVSAAMLGGGLAVWALAGSFAEGLAAYLLLAALIQLAVVALTVAGTRAPSYLTEGRLTKLGSGLLHLGIVLFAVVIVALQASPLMLPVFWASTVLVLAGSALSFYAGPAQRALLQASGRG